MMKYIQVFEFFNKSSDEQQIIESNSRIMSVMEFKESIIEQIEILNKKYVKNIDGVSKDDLFKSIVSKIANYFSTLYLEYDNGGINHVRGSHIISFIEHLNKSTINVDYSPLYMFLITSVQRKIEMG